MKYWLAISNRDNSSVVIKEKLWGVSKRFVNQISITNPGDILLVYSAQKVIDKETVLPSAITACFKIKSKVFEADSNIFIPPQDQSDEVFPLRIRLTTEKIFDPPIKFTPLIPKLKFITNKKMWTGHIRGKAIREIPEEDFFTIINAEGKE